VTLYLTLLFKVFTDKDESNSKLNQIKYDIALGLLFEVQILNAKNQELKTNLNLTKKLKKLGN